jgi:lysophospholipase L1-like esterase
VLAFAAGAAGCSDDGSAVDESTGRASIVVVGDSYTEGVEQGGLGDANWTAQLRSLLRSNDERTALTVDGSGGSGYVSVGWRNVTFGQMADRTVDGSADIVIVFGSINDMFEGASIADVTRAARDTYTTIRAAAPGATLMVIGPSPTGDEVPDELRRVSEGVARAAADAGATFVDPIAERWFSGDAAALISDDDLHPTDDGHAYIAELVLPHVEAAIDARTGG